jgi:predicted GNAT family acetyltransferase
MAGSLKIQTLAENPGLKKAARVIEQAAWGGLEYLNYTRPHYRHYTDVCDLYADYQMCLVDEETGYPLATANCAPIACDANALPPEGWDWIVETAANDLGGAKNMLGCLAISVPTVHRGKGYAGMMIRAFLDKAREKGLAGLVAPVRPSRKAEFFDVPIDEYITWKDGRGRMFDPWLRNHLSAGGRIVAPCKRSMVVKEPLGFWETWTKRRFEKSGAYAVHGALVPVEIDLEAQTGSYEEPNVWMAYAA